MKRLLKRTIVTALAGFAVRKGMEWWESRQQGSGRRT